MLQPWSKDPAKKQRETNIIKHADVDMKTCTNVLNNIVTKNTKRYYVFLHILYICFYAVYGVRMCICYNLYMYIYIYMYMIYVYGVRLLAHGHLQWATSCSIICSLAGQWKRAGHLKSQSGNIIISSLWYASTISFRWVFLSRVRMQTLPSAFSLLPSDQLTWNLKGGPSRGKWSSNTSVRFHVD